MMAEDSITIPGECEMVRKLFVALILILSVTPSVVHGIRGLKLLGGNNGISVADCNSETMGTLKVALGTPPDVPADYEVILDDNLGGINVTVNSFDPLVDGDLSAGVVMADNLHAGGRYGGGQTPAESFAGSLGVDWSESSSRNVDIIFDCTDCAGEVSVELIQRTWHCIALHWYSGDPNHYLETATVPSDSVSVGAKVIRSKDVHLDGSEHELFIHLDRWINENGVWYGGSCGSLSSGNSTPHSGTYKQRQWNSNSAFPSPTSFSGYYTYGQVGPNNLGQNEWGMSTYGDSTTDFDFTVSVQANFSSTTQPIRMGCGNTGSYPATESADVVLLVTDGAFSSEADPNPSVKSDASLAIQYGSYVFVWKVHVTRNCDSGGIGCPCLKYGPDDDTGTPKP